MLMLLEQGGIKAAYYESAWIAGEEGLHGQHCQRRQESMREHEKPCGHVLMLFGQEVEVPGMCNDGSYLHIFTMHMITDRWRTRFLSRTIIITASSTTSSPSLLIHILSSLLLSHLRSPA
jgi:hypothetical protein